MPKARPRVDYTGQTFFNWTVVQYIPYKHSTYLCRCVCGVEKEKQIHAVIRGKSKSCGCRRNAAVKEAAEQAAAQAPIQQAAAVQLTPTPTPTPPSTSVEPEYRMREFNGHQIRQRVSDEYFDATAMCNVAGKRLNDWRRLDSTPEYLHCVSRSTGYPVDLLVEIRSTGLNELRGTWVHPRVAMRLSQWINPEFANTVDEWVWKKFQGESGDLQVSTGEATAPATITPEMLMAMTPEQLEMLKEAMDRSLEVRRLKLAMEREMGVMEGKLAQIANYTKPFDPFTVVYGPLQPVSARS